MAHIPARFLVKKGAKWRSVNLSEMITLLAAVAKAAEHPEIGNQDINNTDVMLKRSLNKYVLLDPALLESALWCCNMLEEEGEFHDYKGRTFDQFVSDLLGGKGVFDKTYNLIKWSKHA